MPLSNDKEKYWIGWLVDGLGGREPDVQQQLAAAIEGAAALHSVSDPVTP